MLLELTMADCSGETADIFDNRKNGSWLKMLAHVEILSTVTNCPPTEVYTEPSEATAQNSTEDPTPLRSRETGQGLPIVIRPTPSSIDCQKNSAVSRSGRSVRPPSYLKDYVQT